MSVPRWVNVVAGIWLFLSALLLPAPAWQRVTQAFMGMAIFLVAIVAMAYARFRWINTLLALWAVLAPFALALPASAAAENQLATGLVVLVASLWPGHRDAKGGHPVPR